MRFAPIAVIAAVVLVAAPAIAASWQAYRYPDIGFAADYPAAPTRLAQPIDTSSGAVPTVFVYAQDEGRTYFASSSDLAGRAELASPPSDVARAVLDGALTNRTIVSPPASVPFAGGGGWEATSSDAKTAIRTRSYMAGHYAYTVMVIGPVEQASALHNADAERFLNSFKVVR